MLTIRFKQVTAQLRRVDEHERDFLALLLLASDRSLPEQTRGFLADVADILRHGLANGDNLGHAVASLPVLCDVAEKVFAVPGSLVHAHEIDSFVVYPIVMMFGGGCRVRFYWIDYDKQQYQARLSQPPNTAFTGTGLPLLEPPYVQVDGTNCFALRHSDLEKQFANDREVLWWYQTVLGFGSIVTESYTWHIAGSQVVRWGDSIRNGVWAVSFDLGPAESRADGKSDATCDPILLKVFDRIMEVGLAERFNSVLFAVQADGASFPDDRQRVASVAPSTVTPTGASMQSAHSTRFPDPTVKGESNGSVVDANGIENARARFVPAGRDGQPWICDDADPSGRSVFELYRRACALQGPSSIAILGETGSGKGMLLRSIHEFSNRGGGYEEIVAHAQNPERVRYEMRGTDEVFTDADPYVSKLAKADTGVVCFSEFLHLLLSHRDGQEIEWRHDVDDAIYGRMIRSYPNGKKTPFRNKSLLAFEGSKDSWIRVCADPALDHWRRRCTKAGFRIEIPSWSSFSAESHALLLRWALLMCLKSKGLRAGAFESCAYNALMAASRAEKKGPATIFNAVVGAFSVQGNEGVVTASTLADNGILLDSAMRRGGSPPAGKTGSMVLELGIGSKYSTRLTEFEKLVMRIYELSIRYPTADAVVPEGEKITEATLTSALEGIPEDDMLLHHYLLWAAARMRHQTDADDTRRTAPKRVESFFATRSPYHEALERTLGPGITPLKLQIRGKDNDKQRGASLFEPVVMKSAGELQARVERISCGFPPFLHYVPFWLHNEIKV